MNPPPGRMSLPRPTISLALVENRLNLRVVVGIVIIHRSVGPAGCHLLAPSRSDVHLDIMALRQLVANLRDHTGINHPHRNVGHVLDFGVCGPKQLVCGVVKHHHTNSSSPLGVGRLDREIACAALHDHHLSGKRVTPKICVVFASQSVGCIKDHRSCHLRLRQKIVPGSRLRCCQPLDGLWGQHLKIAGGSPHTPATLGVAIHARSLQLNWPSLVPVPRKTRDRSPSTERIGSCRTSLTRDIHGALPGYGCGRKVDAQPVSLGALIVARHPKQRRRDLHRGRMRRIARRRGSNKCKNIPTAFKALAGVESDVAILTWPIPGL
mmetsp:Transcript_52604/g.139684  ORF Transcript_52604/g.139684 Transcript_52604/m.139684 type:complete len:323 (-) Transcript_52604:72-1040(-)